MNQTSPLHTHVYTIHLVDGKPSDGRKFIPVVKGTESQDVSPRIFFSNLIHLNLLLKGQSHKMFYPEIFLAISSI